MEMISNDILTLAALVAAFVGVIKSLGIDAKYSPIIALVIAAVFVLVPEVIQSKLLLIAVVGLSASGVYHYSKNKGDGSNDKGL